MSGELISRPSCILSVIVLILLVSSTGLLVMVLKGDYAHPHEETTNSSHHHHHHHTTTTVDVQSDLPPGYSPEEPWKNFRLPDTVRPVHYELTLKPNLKWGNFGGILYIDVNVTRRTRYFLVHVSPVLTVSSSDVMDGLRQFDLELEKKFRYEHNEFFVLEVKEEVDPGLYSLYFRFGGKLDQNIYGLYSSIYRNSRGEDRTLALSKFQPYFTRRAFPCFDEPRFKATFNISLVHAPDYTPLSNMPPLETTPYSYDTSMYITKFMTTVPMVTYLTNYIVCEFQYTEIIMSSGKPFRVYSQPDAVNATMFALQTGYRILEYYEKYFGIDYPLPKLDLVAVPEFAADASEYWGLITIKEEFTLFHPGVTSPLDQQNVANVIAHELVHMWFGNLVTMEWWDELWFNEGFASYMEYAALDYLYPDWDIKSQFLIEDLQIVMVMDSTIFSRPIVTPVTIKSEIGQQYSRISYSKGASIARMMEFFIGSENFKNGISNFLSKHQFQNAGTKGLWEEMASACGRQGNRSISDFMISWTEQMGFPYVTVRRKFANSSTFIAKQRRFLRHEETHRQKEDTSQKSVWIIPLSYKSSDGTEGIVWIHDDAETEFTLPLKDFDWLKFNVNQTGFYLVNYDEDDWKTLTDVLLNNHELLSPSDRSNLLFDAFLLAEAGHVNIDLFLTLSQYLKNETHYTPWATAQRAFQRILRRLDEDPGTSLLLQDHIRYLTSGLYTQLGWNTTEDHLENLLRSIIIDMTCSAGDQHCLEHASKLFWKWTEGERIPVGVRNLVYKFGMAEAEEEDWSSMWNKYLVEESPSQKKAYLEGLAHVQEPSLIQRYLEYNTDTSKIRDQDNEKVLAYLLDNQAARKQTWSFLNKVQNYLFRIVQKYCEHLTSEDELKQMKEHFLSNPNATLHFLYQSSLEEIEVNIRWLRTQHRHLKSWLETESPAPWLHHRLPRYSVPLHYDLQLQPALDGEDFSGSVAIQVQLQRPSGCFVLHAAADLNLTRVEVTMISDEKGESKDIELEEFFRHQEHDYLVLKTKERLPIGRYRLYFEFVGPLTLSFKGLYKSSYVDPVLNETRYLAATQFEATDARSAFPCFDEPRHKTTFNVSIVHEPRHIALSNMMEEDTTELENGLLVTRFKKTLPMVTYLLAVVVCDYEYKETITENGVRLRIYTPPHHIEKIHYALQVGSRILTYYENYFDIPFPMEKLDMIPIPDFGSNGMENWGLVTYSEKSLISENASTVDMKQHIVNIIGHELAHMWFGDLVTMEWWSDLWLNEGFATYLSLRGAKLVEPEFNQFYRKISSYRNAHERVSDFIFT